MFNNSSDKLNKNIILQNLNKCNNFSVICLESINSTNSYGKELLKLSCEKSCVIASETQDMGRGRMGRKFFSPTGGIYFSILLKIPSLYTAVPFITTAVAVAVCRVLREISGKDALIKWVNDIYVDNQKICGILSEIADENHAVVGIGINFYESELPKEISSFATSLFKKESPVSKNVVIAKITNEFTGLIDNLPSTSFLEDYKNYSLVLGKEILFSKNGETFLGKAIDIDSFGGLIVSTNSGVTHLNSGEITVRVKSQNQEGQT